LPATLIRKGDAKGAVFDFVRFDGQLSGRKFATELNNHGLQSLDLKVGGRVVVGDWQTPGAPPTLTMNANGTHRATSWPTQSTRVMLEPLAT
jgi:hypothetical protein